MPVLPIRAAPERSATAFLSLRSSTIKWNIPSIASVVQSFTKIGRLQQKSLHSIAVMIILDMQLDLLVRPIISPPKFATTALVEASPMLFIQSMQVHLFHSHKAALVLLTAQFTGPMPVTLVPTPQSCYFLAS
jgi:hypothetical protein